MIAQGGASPPVYVPTRADVTVRFFCFFFLVQDLTVKLSEVLVAIAIVATVEGSPALTDLASSTMVELVTGPSGYNETTHGAALQALMPVLLMSAGKADVPPRSVVRSVSATGCRRLVRWFVGAGLLVDEARVIRR